MAGGAHQPVSIRDIQDYMRDALATRRADIQSEQSVYWRQVYGQRVVGEMRVNIIYLLSLL